MRITEAIVHFIPEFDLEPVELDEVHIEPEGMYGVGPWRQHSDREVSFIPMMFIGRVEGRTNDFR